jgi:hypothetical protein
VKAGGESFGAAVRLSIALVDLYKIEQIVCRTFTNVTMDARESEEQVVVIFSRTHTHTQKKQESDHSPRTDTAATVRIRMNTSFRLAVNADTRFKMYRIVFVAA